MNGLTKMFSLAYRGFLKYKLIHTVAQMLRHSMNNNKVFFAATGLKLISILGLLMMPFQIGVFIEFLGLTPSQAGLIASLETSALALGVVLVSFRMIPLTMVSTATVGVVLVIAGNLVSALLVGQLEIIAARCITGLGYGIANATASRLIATCFSVPESAAGKMYAVTYIAATAMYYFFPPIIADGGSYIFFWGLTLLVLVICPVLVYLPRNTDDRIANPKTTSIQALFFRLPVIGFFLIEILLMLGLGSIWAFAERFAVNIDLSVQRIGLYFALSSGTQFLGACLAAYLGIRFGRTKPLTLSLIPWAIFSIVLATANNEWAFAVGILGYQFILAFYIPYMLGVGAAFDKGGNVAAAVIGVQIFSFGAGSYLGGLVADSYGLAAIGWLAIFCCGISILLFPKITKPLELH